MHKFTISNLPDTDETQPVLYKLFFGKMYYVHKGKTLIESADKLLDDVFRGLRNKKYPEAYSKIIDYCQQYPATTVIKIEKIFNGEPAKLLKKEDALYKAMRNDPMSLNRLDIAPYKPEWMVKAAFQERCLDCPKTGVIEGKKTQFKFCPNCGRINRALNKNQSNDKK